LRFEQQIGEESEWQAKLSRQEQSMSRPSVLAQSHFHHRETGEKKYFISNVRDGVSARRMLAAAFVRSKVEHVFAWS
jgi:hypothetical protein